MKLDVRTERLGDELAVHALNPRHGFVPARAHALRWEHGHDDAFFVQALSPAGLSGVAGVVRYRPEFDAL